MKKTLEGKKVSIQVRSDMNENVRNVGISEEEFVKGQKSVVELLEQEKDDVTSLRRYFVSDNNSEIDKPASVFYSTLAVMDLEGVLEKEGIVLSKDGDYHSVPMPERFDIVELGFTLSLSDEELEQFRQHFEDDISPDDLEDNGFRYSDRQEYGTGYSLSRELGVLNDINHAWTGLDVQVPVAYLTPEVKNLVVLDLDRYASTILERDYDTVKSRAENQDAVAGI